MNLREVKRSLRADYEEKRNIEALRQKKAQEELYLNHPELKEMEKEHNQMKMEVMKAALAHPDQALGAQDQLEELEENFSKSLKDFFGKLGLDNDPREARYDCTICQDTGQTDKGPCLCFKQKLAQHIFRREYERGGEQASLSTMNFQIYSDKKEAGKPSQRDNIISLVGDLHKYVEGFDDELKGTNIIFSGPVSQGKTYLSAALALELIDQGKMVIYQTLPSLMDLLRELSWNYDRDSVQLKQMVYDADMLILDDLGKENINDFARRQLFHIINMRYTARKSTLISSNLDLMEIRKAYGEAFFSRLMEKCLVPSFYGPDLRIGE